MAPMDDILAEYCFALFWATLYVGISFLNTTPRSNNNKGQGGFGSNKWLQMSRVWPRATYAAQFKETETCLFYRTRVRSLAMLVSN